MISAVAPLRPNNIDFHLNGAELTEKRKGERIKEFCEFFVDIFNEHPFLFHETMLFDLDVKMKFFDRVTTIQSDQFWLKTKIGGFRS